MLSECFSGVNGNEKTFKGMLAVISSATCEFFGALLDKHLLSRWKCHEKKRKKKQWTRVEIISCTLKKDRYGIVFFMYDICIYILKYILKYIVGISHQFLYLYYILFCYTENHRRVKTKKSASPLTEFVAYTSKYGSNLSTAISVLLFYSSNPFAPFILWKIRSKILLILLESLWYLIFRRCM